MIFVHIPADEADVSSVDDIRLYFIHIPADDADVSSILADAILSRCFSANVYQLVFRLF